MADLLLTTGESFEGYEVTEYLGFVVGQAVYQSKFIKGIAADVMGDSDQDLDDLNDCDEEVKNSLIKSAKEKDANAIIGIQMRYAELASGSFAVIMTGTAVKIKKKELIIPNVYKELFVTNYYVRLVPRPVKVIVDGSRDEVNLSVWFYNYNLDDINAVRADVELTNIYDEKLVMKGVDLVFDKGNVSLIKSDFVDCGLSVNDIKLLKDAKVIINKYVTPRGIFACNDTPVNVSMTTRRLEALKAKRGIDAVEKYRTDGMIWTCNCGHVNEAGNEECIVCGRKQDDMKVTTKFDYEKMIEEMRDKEYVNEIKDVLMGYIKEIDNKYRIQLLEIMESGQMYEKTRGNMKESVIEKVEKVFEDN
ncbi:MAG: heavy metal-binding domain-containing protein [Eubacterium sp.]|nr:heavy metal-binding domain-containing protein [Eubacterium sp.]